MNSLNQLRDKIIEDIELYLSTYGDLPDDDIFALKFDIVQIVRDHIEESQDVSWIRMGWIRI